ncbi:MAG: N-acetyltransferase family protein [Planctomycetota bacterium]
MLIRPTAHDDFDAIAAMTNHFIRETSIHFGYEEMTPDECREPWLRDRERFPWLTAEIDGVFAGCAKAGVWRGRKAYENTAETAVYVEPSMHRRGVGRALYGALLEELRTRGFHVAVGGITLPNDASVALHEAMGYRSVGTFEEVGWKFGTWWSVGFWSRKL